VRASLRTARVLDAFDYNAPAELYPSRSRRMRGPVAYKRFDSAAEAIRYAVEDLPESGLNGATLEVKEVRFGRDEILYLYAQATFPLERRKQAV
jgi:Arc/MetJ-type ribon-helix-helix transcriptional regulator